MEAMEAIGRKLELGIFRTSKPIKEEKNEKKEQKEREARKKDKSPAKEGRSRTASQSPTKSPEPKTQMLFMRTKKEKECTADARIHKRSVARESAHRTIPVPCACPVISKEKVALTIRAASTEEPSRPISPTDSAAPTTTGSCAHLVERKLTEIAKQAEELAKTIRRAAEELPDEADEEEETATQQDVESLALDSSITEEQPLHVEVAPPVVKASQCLSLSSPKSPKGEQTSPRPALASRNVSTTPENETIHRSTDLKQLAEATRSLLMFAERNKVEKSMSQTELAREGRDIRPTEQGSGAAIGQGQISTSMSSSEIRPMERHRESLADRLTKGIHDLTHGSSDRLQKWKSKLQTTGRRSKDQSEPPPISRPMISGPCQDVLLDWSSVHRSPRPLHSSKSATNALKNNNVPDPMDHRTLKNRETAGSQGDLAFHYQHMNSLQKIMNTLDGYAKTASDLPPPARFMPQSGVKPTHDDIIRPIAFRPVGNQQSDDRQRMSHGMGRTDRHVIRGDLAKSAHNLSSFSTSNSQLYRPRPTFLPSTSFSPVKPQENEYDTVPEYLEKEKMSDFGSSGSDYGCFVPNKLSSSTVSSGTASSHLSSPPGTNKKSYPSLGSTGRSSSGVHVTPSPSDSGIVDFETMMRDKENELREVRTTMEQNEEIIVKVYQEKERLWKEELEQLRTRLSASERGEHALRAQLAGCQRQTDTLNRNVDGLREEKTGLLRKCFQLEREMTQLKLELDKPRTCADCHQRQKPIPAPRHIKDADSTIRGEVSSLRSEVETLKDALNGQIQLFTEERKKWERENNSCRSESSQVSVGRDRLI